MVKYTCALCGLALGIISCYLQTVHSDSTQIHKYVYNNNGLGVYSFEFKTSDGTYRREEGGLHSGNDGFVVRGEYGYSDPSGRRYSVRYIADASGYQPQVDEDYTRFNDRRII